MHFYVGENKLTMTLEDNSSVDALIVILQEGDITYQASDYGGFEKVGNLGHTLPTNHTPTDSYPGDVVLYQSSQIVIFYGNNSWSYTKLGHIDGYSAEELANLLYAGESVEIRLSLE